MLRFISITMRNFLSYGNNTTVVQLDRPGTTLIVGEDLDNTANGQGANGVGKTTMINALAYAIFDKPVSSISKDNLVNNINKKNMEVTATFEKNGVYYHVKRVRKSKSYAAGNYVKLYMRHGDANFCDADEITPDSVANTNKLIEKIIGIPHELFVRIVVFSATHIPFLDLPVRHPTSPSQTAIIEELFELTELAEDAENLKVLIKENEQKLSNLKSTISHLEKEHMRHADQLKSAKRRIVAWQHSNTSNIKELEVKLSKIQNVDIEGQRSLHEKVVDIEQQLSNALEEQRKIEGTLNDLKRKETKREHELSHLQDERCPFCLQKYENADDKIHECEDELFEVREKSAEFNEALETIETQVAKLTKSHKKLTEKIVVSNLEELLEIKNQSTSIQEKIESLKNAVNPFFEPYEELEAVQLDKINYDEVNHLTKVIEHQKFLLKLLTKKDSFVRKALLNKNIPFLNARLQKYLNDLGLPHTIEFSHELIAVISQFGRPLDFGNLSNGQRARVNLALSFAFRDVLQKLHVQINVCMLDEVLDVGLDTVGVQAAARMLKRKARDEKLSLYIISHRDEIDSAFDNTMTVQMTKGFSYIKED